MEAAGYQADIIKTDENKCFFHDFGVLESG
jgi:hypothetical protein